MGRGKNRDVFLQAGAQLLGKQGFAATGVQEIADAGGLPKGSFYNYFKSKEDFAAQVIGQYVESMGAYLDQELLQADGTPLSRLRALFDDWSDNQFVKYGGFGCIAGNLCQELAIQSETLRSVLDEGFDVLQGKFAACLNQAKGAGEIAQDADVELLAGFVYNAWQGALLRAKAQGSTVAFDQFRAVVFSRVLG